MTLEEFNALPVAEAREALTLCCVSNAWIDGVLAGRPFASAAALVEHSTAVWSRLGEADYLQAFEGHPKIGDVDSLRKKYAASGALAAGEQAGVREADAAVIEGLAAGNARYEARFGFIFIVCASGRSAGEMLAMLEARLRHSREQELAIAAEEQRRILTLRLENML